MFAYIKGILADSSTAHAVVDVHGVGYLIYIPTNLYSKLPQTGCELILFTSYIVREQSQALYGFPTAQERDIFETLMNVSGIGPKLALNIVGHLSMHELQHAVSNHEIVTLCKVPGIGKKTAERLIIELRDKLQGMLPPVPSEFAIMPQDRKSVLVRDAMSTLINLGYNQGTAQKAIKKTLKECAEEEVELAAFITLSLKNV